MTTLAESICCASGLGHELFGIPALADRLLSSLLHVLGCPLLFEGTAGLLRLGRRSFFWCHGCTLRQRQPFRSLVPQRGTIEPSRPLCRDSAKTVQLSLPWPPTSCYNAASIGARHAG